MRIRYFLGRGLQLVGLLAMPSAVWMTEVERSEAKALTVFFGALMVFLAGWILAREKVS